MCQALLCISILTFFVRVYISSFSITFHVMQEALQALKVLSHTSVIEILQDERRFMEKIFLYYAEIRDEKLSCSAQCTPTLQFHLVKSWISRKTLGSRHHLPLKQNYLCASVRLGGISGKQRPCYYVA